MPLTASVRDHWPEYLIEGWALGTFMVSAGVFSVLADAPGSALQALLPDPDLRRMLVGIAMGLTAIALIYSPWGKRSGAQMNPAVTLSFLLLGRMQRIDAACFVLAQFAGALLGVLAVLLICGERFSAAPVSFAQTVPGPDGAGIAFAVELGMSFALMLMILLLSNNARLAPYTGIAAGIAVATYIAAAGPVSGMSINPARSFASALPAGMLEHLWLYFSAPPLGMLLASGCYRLRGQPHCAKLIHPDNVRCIHCGHEPVAALPAAPVNSQPEGGPL